MSRPQASEASRLAEGFPHCVLAENEREVLRSVLARLMATPPRPASDLATAVEQFSWERRVHQFARGLGLELTR